ncbi:MAG: nodulation protein NfeD [Dysgonamonadaceae bacterium]|jgi:membrane-bound serine protease (ClpP class)|nr:nodulation protein NfeD [Dysgonamonadaceae bacterium]
MKTHLSFFFALFFLSGYVFAENSVPLVYQITIDKEINPTSRIYLLNGLKEAKKLNADQVLLRLNTYGGSVVDADSMRSAILYNPIPVSVFIDNNAASAGALISIACENIYMRRGANIGAATVVNTTGEQMPDKYQSYMRSTIRATAEAHGKDTIFSKKDTILVWKRDPRIAEAMVDGSIYIPNVVDSGKVLTLTAQEALKLGFCDGIAESVHEVITKFMGYPEYKLVEYKPSGYDNLKGFLMNPAFQAILIMLIIAGIYFELQSPGVGIPSIVAVTAAILYFAPLYMDGLVQNWEIIVFIIGIILIGVEIFIIPGFGVTGIAGIVLIVTGLSFALLDNDGLSFKEVQAPDLSRSVLTVLSGIVLGFVLMIYLSSKIGSKGIFRKIALTTDLENSISIDTEVKTLVGAEGEAVTVLRPSGKIMVNNEIYDAVSEIGFIEKGTKIKVNKVESAQFYVEPV